MIPTTIPVSALLLTCIATTFFAAADETSQPFRAARSVHWGWASPDATHFYLEMVVDQSTTGSYFMACGWNTGYFGIQELGSGKKVAIFSVWDPTRGDDPRAVTPEQRVELLHQHPDSRIKRFGGEGTGGQCMIDFPWELGTTNKFLVIATPENGKTAYQGHLWMPQSNTWAHLVTFRTRTGDKTFNGFYSFVEDFRRDFKSVFDTRSARFGNGWVKSTDKHWVALRRARFTASGADWESKDNINGELKAPWFILSTGGSISSSTQLRSWIELPPISLPQSSNGSDETVP